MTDITTTAPGIDPTEDMSEEEGRRLIELEREVEKAMRSAGRIAGAALREIRDCRLYRASHTSFESYLLERHGLARSSGYRMIAQASGENGESPAVAAISAASARATERRHTTLDQPPTTITPHPEPLHVVPDAPEKPEGERPAPERPKPNRIHPDAGYDAAKAAQAARTNRATIMDGGPPTPARTAAMQARNDLNRLMAQVDAIDAEAAAKISTAGERLRIARMAAPFAAREREVARTAETATPETCDHPVGRRIGNQCGKCGAVRKAK